MAARRMGYRVHTFSPETDTPTGQVADKEWSASYHDLAPLKKFAAGVDVITIEFENIPLSAIQAVEPYAPVRPGGAVLHTAQHRLREKTFLKNNGFPVTPFLEIRSETDLEHAARGVGFPSVVKTAGFGYDGKGQRKVNSIAELRHAFEELRSTEAILEGFVDFEKEISVIGARSLNGSFVHYGVMENDHKNHILDVAMAPAAISPQTARQAEELAGDILKQLDVVGVMCVEMFLTKKEALIVNELAPRPHNSGHLTIDACLTSQFEQQLRAVCGLPLGSTMLRRPAAMANLLGDLWKKGEPKWESGLKIPGAQLHLYGKTSPRSGRKMGHLTVLADTPQEARRNVLRARSSLV